MLRLRPLRVLGPPTSATRNFHRLALAGRVHKDASELLPTQTADADDDADAAAATHAVHAADANNAQPIAALEITTVELRFNNNFTVMRWRAYATGPLATQLRAFKKHDEIILDGALLERPPDAFAASDGSTSSEPVNLELYSIAKRTINDSVDADELELTPMNS